MQNSPLQTCLSRNDDHQPTNVVRHAQSAVQVEGSVYVGITLAMDIAEVPAVASTAERTNWESTFLGELTTVLSTGLNAAQEAAACDELCGDQLRFIGVHAASIVVTVQVLPVCAVQFGVVLTTLAALTDTRTVLLRVLPSSRTLWTCSKICERPLQIAAVCCGPSVCLGRPTQTLSWSTDRFLSQYSLRRLRQMYVPLAMPSLCTCTALGCCTS